MHACCRIAVTFQDDKDNSTKTVQVPIGESLLEAAHSNDIDLEGMYSMQATPSTGFTLMESKLGS